jgi:uncharacterized protein (TIGR03067 family)
MCTLTTGLLLLAVLATCSRTPGDEPPKGDLAKLQGTWTVVSGERGGKSMDASRIADRQVVIRGNTFTDQNTTKKEILARGTLTINETKSPRRVDARFDFGELAGKSCKAIYEVDGDTFRTCTGVEGDERPTSFRSQPATGQMMFVYRRAR